MIDEVKLEITKNDFINLGKPRVLQLSLTNKCNARCEFCFPQNSKKLINLYKHKRTMDDKLLRKILDDIKDGDEIQTVVLGGSGEMLLYDGILEIIKELKKKNKRVEIQTNGTLLNTKEIYYLKEIGLDALQISIDAIKKETFKEIIHVDKYEIFLNTLKIASKVGIEIKSHTVLIKENIREFHKFANFLFDNDIFVSSASFSCVRDDDFIKNKNINKVSKAEIDELYNNLAYKLDRLGIPHNLKVLTEIYSNNEEIEFKLFKQDPFVCNEIFETLTIFHTGHYGTCCGSNRYYKFDAENFTIKDLFNSQVYKELRKGFLFKKPSKICDNKWCEDRFRNVNSVKLPNILERKDLLSKKIVNIVKTSPLIVWPAGRLFAELVNVNMFRHLDVRCVVDIVNTYKRSDFISEKDFLKVIQGYGSFYIFLCTTENKVKETILHKIKKAKPRNKVTVLTLI
ncbi:radical SAM/SPASM domain-containing protein [Hippea jasoniae]|uniref:radical SAM/SPASM domain-containing protein n=1 Tax=Hippea jasoniae TaxID=944479 RepID=UPI0005548947|nr:radical SAM/SPASM domain-containing protein [Hippea jasoniae]